MMVSKCLARFIPSTTTTTERKLNMIKTAKNLCTSIFTLHCSGDLNMGMFSVFCTDLHRHSFAGQHEGTGRAF